MVDRSINTIKPRPPTRFGHPHWARQEAHRVRSEENSVRDAEPGDDEGLLVKELGGHLT